MRKQTLPPGINAFHFIQTLTIGAVHKLAEHKAAYNVCVLLYQTTNMQSNHISDLKRLLNILATEMNVSRSDIRAKKIGIDLDVGLRAASESVGFETSFDVMHLYRAWYAKFAELHGTSIHNKLKKANVDYW